jgi:GNAT superfamily N-acetyltransferase
MRCSEATKAKTVSDLPIRFSSSKSRWDGMDDYSTCIEVTARCFDKRGNERIMGKVRLFYLDLGAVFDTNDSVHDLFDIRPETAPFYSALIDYETGDFKSNLVKILGEYICDLNVLIVDRLEILPEFRGKKIGLACLRWCLQQYAHACGVVALKCFPLQFECAEMGEPAWRREMQFGKLSRDRKTSLAKLKKYYASLGFKVLPGNDIMVAFAG